MLTRRLWLNSSLALALLGGVALEQRLFHMPWAGPIITTCEYEWRQKPCLFTLVIG